VRAFALAGDPSFTVDENEAFPPYQPEKLYYHTLPQSFMRWMVRLAPLYGDNPRRWGKNGDINLAELTSHNFIIDAEIDFREVKEQKKAASACHASQGGMGFSQGRYRWLHRLLAADRDQFMRAVPPSDGRREKDLFAGLTFSPKS
jgi:hypothetical protein